MENTIDIYNLLPEEINEAIKKLTAALEVVKYRKNTNSKFVDKEKKKLFVLAVSQKELLKMGMIRIKFKLIIVRTASRNLVHVLIHPSHIQN